MFIFIKKIQLIGSRYFNKIRPPKLMTILQDWCWLFTRRSKMAAQLGTTEETDEQVITSQQNFKCY